MNKKELKEIKRILKEYNLNLLAWKPDRKMLYKVYSGVPTGAIVNSEVMNTSELKMWIDGFLAGTRVKRGE